MWTKRPTDIKAVEASASLWTKREAGVGAFMDEVWCDSWSWSDTDTLFTKFKTWMTGTGTTYTLPEKNSIYVGLASDVADMERGATMARLGKNFDEGKAMVGSENILPYGYSDVTDKLGTMISAFPKCSIRLNMKVVKVKTAVVNSIRNVTVTLNGGASYSAPRIIVSVPLGVLQHGTIAFEPALSTAKTTAMAKLGMGLLDKVTLLYDKNFWRLNANGLGGATWFEVVDPTANPVGVETPRPMREFFNAAKYFNDKPVITMLHGADTANEYEEMTDAQLVNITDNLFRSLWTGTSNAVIKSYLITRWKADEHARGSYSYLPPGATVSMRTDLCKYLGDGIYWAGEHCSIDWPATVNGAFDSGLSASRAIISATPKPTSKPSTTRPTRSPSSRPTPRKPTSKPSTKKPTSIIV
jgi:hypothetical protein